MRIGDGDEDGVGRVLARSPIGSMYSVVVGGMTRMTECGPTSLGGSASQAVEAMISWAIKTGSSAAGVVCKSSVLAQ